MEKAIVDRLVDGKHAVLLVGAKEIEKVIPSSKLPSGVTAGTVVKVEFRGDELGSIEADHEETDKTKERIKSKLELLRERSKSKD
ncbi:DUF3006 domain-containing protein [Halalkalibacter kiskunsagensis]|uniref:DUF3006 domain-containing protein n=1 Tax=Halalkalibacter kiskunsagensis TaxID=1548599 RepID=A0ABV6KAW3_9BACI